MAPHVSQQIFRRSLLCAEVGDAVRVLLGNLAGLDVDGLAMDAEDLLRVGKRDIALQLSADPDRPLFNAAVCELLRAVQRGKKNRDSMT